MSSCGDHFTPKNPWKRTNDKIEEPVVSLVEIMSEDLANSLAEDDEQRDLNMALAMSTEISAENDEELARALQAEFDKEEELLNRLEQDKQQGSVSVYITPKKYCPKSKQEQESDDEEEGDDDELREIATSLLYAKLDESHQSSSTRFENGEFVTKHNASACAKRNADKSLNDNVGIKVGDMSSAEISNKVYNKLRSFAKDEVKRQHRLKDKEEKATIETSVDSKTRITLFKWINQGVFDRVHGVIATGKESAVLQAIQGSKEENYFAVKVYKTTLSEFKNRMSNSGLPCPEPIKVKKNLLAMSFIGEESEAAPRLINVDWDFFTEDEIKDVFNQVQSIMIRMYKECKLVHGDLSEFNLLLLHGKVFVIDVSQAMDISHPRNLYFLARDIENVLKFFQAIGLQNLPTPASLFNLITDLEMTEDDNLFVQVEQFSAENRTVTLRNDKQAPADMDLRLYNSERPARGPSPAREYN